MKYSFLKILLWSAVWSSLLWPEINAQDGSDSPGKVALHYTFSAGISFAACRLLSNAHPDMSMAGRYLISAGISLSAGFAKEILDEISGHYFDWYDIGIDVLGTASGLLIHYGIFDMKNAKGDIALNLADPRYLATVTIRF